jgi:hypothetical protein
MSSPTLVKRHPLRQIKAPNRLLILFSALAAIWFVMSNQRAEGACAVPNFTLASTTAASLRATTVADFNNDGKPDIAVAGSTLITVLLGNGAGSFTAVTPFSGARNATSVATGDLNGDGNTDLVVANETNVEGIIGIFLGNGAGGFGPRIQVFFTPGMTNVTTSVAIADLNGDGKADVAVTSQTFHSVTTFLGNGTGNVTFSKSLDPGIFSPTSLIIKDLNGDSKPDLIVGDFFNPGKVSRLLGDGAGNFGTAAQFDAGGGPSVINLADFDQDGKTDLASANRFSNNVSILRGDGAGNFGAPANIDLGVSPLAMESRDVNGDGRLDLAVGAMGGHLLILVGDGAGGFSLVAHFFETSSDSATLAIADFNADSQPDIGVGKFNKVVLFQNSCGSPPTSQVQMSGALIAIENAGAGSTTATIVRTGDITGAATIDHATSDDTATAPQDYTAVSGTVSFAAGAYLRTFGIPIVNDSLPEPTESFNVTLSNATGSSILGSPSTVAVFIFDDDASQVSFATSTLTVNEGIGSVAITVNRTGNTSVPATVDYTTSDSAAANKCNVIGENASARCDYITTIGTLVFAAGETSKSVSIPIIDDAYAESAERFRITLSNSTGNAVLGSFPSREITINDNETVNGTNPIDSAAFFVRQHYLDFLNRQPDQAGLDFWVGNFTPCGSDPQCIEVKRINVSGAFFLAIEFQETGYLVERLYKTSYGDATGNSTFPSPHTLPVPIVRFNEFIADSQEIGRGIIVGQPGWQEALETNKQTFIAAFVQRQRFTNAFNATTNEQFVDTLNGNAGNPLSASERDALLADLNNSVKTRAQVLRAVAEDPTLVTAESNRAFVLMQFFGYLRRNPDDPQDTDYSGYDFWLTKLNEFGGNFQQAEMVKAFINSTEYRQRFGP